MQLALVFRSLINGTLFEVWDVLDNVELFNLLYSSLSNRLKQK
jgi:hypothetical protein